MDTNKPTTTQIPPGTIQGMPATQTTPMAATSKKSRIPMIILGVTLLGILIFGGGFWYLSMQQKNQIANEQTTTAAAETRSITQLNQQAEGVSLPTTNDDLDAIYQEIQKL